MHNRYIECKVFECFIHLSSEIRIQLYKLFDPIVHTYGNVVNNKYTEILGCRLSFCLGSYFYFYWPFDMYMHAMSHLSIMGDFVNCSICSLLSRPAVPWGAVGRRWHPQILAYQFNLSQPGGSDFAPTSLQVPPDF